MSDAIVGSPAFEAGISSGMKVTGVNGRVYTQDLPSDAIKSAKDASPPVTLLLVVDDYFRTCTINYHGSARYPHLVRDGERPDYLARRVDQAAPREHGVFITEVKSRRSAMFGRPDFLQVGENRQTAIRSN